MTLLVAHNLIQTLSESRGGKTLLKSFYEASITKYPNQMKTLQEKKTIDQYPSLTYTQKT